MAIGDDAAAAGIPVMTGNEDRRKGWEEINRTRDELARRTPTVASVAKGGTGASTAADARTNLGVPATGEVVKRSGSNVIDLYWGGAGNLRVKVRIDGIEVGTLAYTSDAGGGGFNGGVVANDIYLPNATPATSGYTVAYLNSDGRISKGASSERYKTEITEIDPATLGDIFPALHTFQMVQGDGSTRVGWIAERLAEQPDTEQFVVRDIDGLPDSIDFIALLIAQNAQLHQAVDLLAQRITALEAR